MGKAERLISSAGRATRAEYWLTLAGFFAAWVAAWEMAHSWSVVAAYALLGCAAAVLILQTVRRLHDAGLSRWWAALLLFPVTITLDAGLLQVGVVELKVFDLSQLIRNAPILLGAILPSAYSSKRVELNAT